ncbi:putative disease resistance RPP13-like protein 1 [Senna tora]|uniref:Putative disease resistance RPP13-like protein 1 n=1 Tax=Senna tora TaxID=362788 RepID=A0A834TP73_9FABA|nr:putative disease resistance RPP13-like protein 1 [Senna tora]
MAAATVGGAFLSAFLQVLFDRMAKPEFLDFIQGKNLNGGLLTKLKIHLLSVDAVLNDAEERQTTNLNVKEWLNELKDAMFEAEDIIDKLNTEASLESESEIGNSPTKVQTFFSSALNLFNRRTEKVLDRLDFLIKQKDALEFSFRLEGDNRHLMSRRTRQLSYSNVMFNDSQNIKTICEAKGLRSFISLEVSSWSGRLTNETLNDLLSKLRSLRVLSLSHCQSLTLIPDSLGQLIHLRYLDLSHTAIMKLPDSLCSLYNLQTLLLFNCHLLTELPINIGRLINLRCLNISGTKLIQMPLQIGRLENLHRLTVFTQGKRGSSIQELKRLNCLEGKLSLLNLQNVVDPKDALEASLKDKGQLHELVLKWSGVVDDSQKDRDVLTHLEPPQRLKKIAIEQYGGTKFPDWLGDRKFSNMVSIYLHNCSYCTSLPPLGKLASLKNLSIVGLNVVSIGAEFYGSVTSGEKPFNSLQNLHFENMFELRQWETSGDDNTEIAFPFLRKLSFKNCPNLTKGLPQYLPSLTKLVIIKCQQLVAVLPISATVCEMQLEYCENVPIEELPPNLMKLTLGGYNTRESLFEGNERGNCCIEQQNISYFQSLVYLPIGSMADKIRSLNITNCRNIDFPKYQCFTSLERLFIKRSCNSLKSFELGFFPKLNNLYIYACQNLESISFSRNNGQNLLSLNSLIISECPNFVSFPDGGLPAMNLTCFRIEHCMNLRSLPELMNILLSSLVTLTVWDCPALESFPEGGLPPSLQSLEIYHCDRLFVNRKHWNLQSLPSLGSFAVGGNCEDGEPFPEEGLLPSTITSLNICKLENLKYLNEKGLQNLTSLKTLGIGSCSELQFIPQKLPASLSDLHIWNSPCLEQRCQWGKEDWPKISQIPTIRINSNCSAEHTISLCFISLLRRVVALCCRAVADFLLHFLSGGRFSALFSLRWPILSFVFSDCAIMEYQSPCESMGSGSGGEGCEQNKKRKIASDIRKLRNLSSGSEYNDDGEKEMGSEQIRSSFKKEVVAGENTQSTPDHLLKGDLREEASRQIARFFYTSAVPFNCVKNPEFEKMCRLIADYGPGFKPPTFREVREKFLEEEVEEKRLLYYG